MAFQSPSPEMHLRWFDKSGNVTDTVGQIAYYLGPKLAPDGKQILFLVRDFQNPGTTDLWSLPATGGVPRRLTLRRIPEDRDKAEKEVRSEAKVKDVQSQDLTFRRLKDECELRLAALGQLTGVPATALTDFAEFLVSPGVIEQLQTTQKPQKELTEILDAKSASEVAEIILTMPAERRRDLAKFFKAVLGNKRAKTVSLKTFAPTTDVVWDRGEVVRLVQEFEEFVNNQWEDGTYLKIE